MLCCILPKMPQHLRRILEIIKSDALLTGMQLGKCVFLLHEEVKLVNNVKGKHLAEGITYLFMRTEKAAFI